MKREIIIEWKFQCKKWDFRFVIPDDRADWGGDFFVHQKNFHGAEDGQRVRAEVMERDSGKKPEAKIIEVLSWKNKKPEREVVKVVEGIFSGGNGDFWFVDVPGQDQWYFCYGLKKNGAKDGDKVRAEIKKYNGKDEAIVVEILEETGEVLEGTYSDNDTFGFVKIAGSKDDIFIPGSKKMEAQTGDKVRVRIIKEGGRRREGIIEEIIK